ncbi:MAG: CHASE domain-containing protein [Aquincola sp.]|nr:CHASE domain-containing protein [Aquincola sp.]
MTRPASHPTAAPVASASLPTWAVLAITFFGYLATARLGLLLALPPANASPLFPAAGLGMAAALVWGPRALWAIALAAPAANLWLASAAAPITPGVVAIWFASGAGAALQAAVGARMMRRWIAQPLVLSEPIDLARFMLGVVPVACLTSATVSVLVFWGSGTIHASDAASTWGAWWVGDTLGVLIGGPVALAFFGQPRDAWAPRRWSVAAPLAGATLVMGLGVLETTRADVERIEQAFRREADNATNGVNVRLQTALRALEAMRGIADASPALDRDTFRRAAMPWTIEAEGMVALGLSERVERASIGAFETRERVAGRGEFRITERWGVGAAAPPDDPLMVIRFIEPVAANATALGVNARSIALARAAVDAAARAGRPAATAAFPLSQGGQGVVIYQALYRGEPLTASERERTLRAVVFATLRPDVMLAAVHQQIPSSLELCLLDNQAEQGRRVLAGPSGCDNLDPSRPLHVAPLAFAGRQWDLRIYSNGAADGTIGRAWPLALVGLASAALLGALLLMITGRARRIEAAVGERTAELQQRSAELQAEVAQRQRTASALRESQQRLRNILDHAPIGVAYTDIDGRVREANPHLRDLLGHTGDRLAGTPIADLVHPDDRAAEAQARNRLLAGEVPMAHWHLRCVAADGRVVNTRASVSVLRSGTGEARRLVWVIEDITEHLQLEEAQRARQGAEAANRAKSEFLSRMSHELRTPLNAMLGFTQLLELDRKLPLAPHQLEWTAQMRQAGWHLLHMINDTLDLSRIESGHVELVPQTLDLQEAVESVRTLLAHSAERRRVGVEVHLGTGARSVIGDATRVKQILTNLLSNAIKYNAAGGQVIVSSRLADEGRVALDVIDTGAGMSDEQLAQLFQPFNRLGREAGPIEGTGIGLVISLRLAELMGGKLQARSAIGMGSTFTLELPRGAAAPTTSSAEFEPDVGLGAYRRRLIHYVEDNETNAEVMRGIVALRPQIDLEISSLGLAGLAAIRQRRPSLVLLDMQLPDIDGVDLLRQLKADDETADIPVIVVSADATEARIAEAIAAGAAHYLTKPVSVPQFLSALDSLLDPLDTHFG